MLDVVCWLWRPLYEYRSKFTPEHVNILQRMVARHYKGPHRFSCITDHTDRLGDFATEIRVVPLWQDFAKQISQHGSRAPSCYRRLRAFSPEMKEVIGPRFVSVDLDCVVCDDLGPLWDRPEDFVIWRSPSRASPFNGSMWMMTAGSRAHVWETFKANPMACIVKAAQARFHGSDQAWMSCALDNQEASWTDKDGVFSYRQHVASSGGRLPEGARIVMFNGAYDPDHPLVQSSCPWVREHYR